jgi:hypothetical protein
MGEQICILDNLWVSVPDSKNQPTHWFKHRKQNLQVSVPISYMVLVDYMQLHVLQYLHTAPKTNHPTVN